MEKEKIWILGFSDSEHGQILGCQPRKFWKFQNSETVSRLTKGVLFHPPSKTFSFFSFVGDILDATLPSEQGRKCLRVYRSRISRLNRKIETVGRLKSPWSLYKSNKIKWFNLKIWKKSCFKLHYGARSAMFTPLNAINLLIRKSFCINNIQMEII